MKKLIITISAIALAGVVNAATCSWGSGAIKTAASATGGWSSTGVNTAGALVTMNVYLISSDTYDSLASKTQTELYSAYSGVAASLTGVNKNASDAIIGAITITENDSATAAEYAVVIATYHDATYDKDMYIATRATSTWNAGTQKGSSLNIISTVGAASGWQTQAVPEPTSGLLMLLGMAGLALRRKRT